MKCGVEFTETDWDLYLQQASFEDIEAINRSSANNEPLMICCHKNWSDCFCEVPIDWDDTDKIPVDIWNQIYGDHSPGGCSNCMYQYSEECLPLTGYVVNFIKNGVIGEPVTICSDFEDDRYVAESLMSINYGDF